MNPFQTFLLGFVVLVIGLGIAAYLLGAPPVWIAVGAVILVGIGIILANDRNNPRNPPPPRY